MKVDDVVRIIRAMREFKLSLPEMAVLVCVRDYGRNDTVAMGAAREIVGLSQAYMSVLCWGLEERGLVKIEGSTNDRRAKMLRLTAAGHELCRGLQRSLA